MTFRAPALGRLVSRWATSLQCSRRAETPSVKGIAGTPTTSTFSFLGFVEPVTKASQLQRLPEGARLDAVIQITTQTALRTVGSGFLADLITYNGAAYEVQTVDSWANHADFFRCLATKVGDL